MQSSFPLRSFWTDLSQDRKKQDFLDNLSHKRVSWEEFEDLLSLSRLSSTDYARTLLHLAVLDRRLDKIAQLKEEPLLLSRRDAFGLSPLDLAKLLDDAEAVALLDPNPPQELAEMPKDLGFSYLAYPVFETRRELEEVLTTVAKAKKEDKIPAEKIWMGIYFDKEIRSSAHAAVEVRPVDAEVGFGVFAKKKIAPCSFVGEYTGVIQCKKPKELREKHHVMRYPVWEGKKNYCIDAEKRGNFTRLINHSAAPNLGLQSVYWRGLPRMILISLKEIREGSQLTFDYGPIFWKNHPQSPKILS